MSSKRRSDRDRRVGVALAKWRKSVELPLPSRGDRAHFGSRTWYRECGGKRAHLTLEKAIQHLLELAKKPHVHNSNGARLTVYVCRWCDWFHVGHEIRKEDARASTVYIFGEGLK